jgi:hypothetical protein
MLQLWGTHKELFLGLFGMLNAWQQCFALLPAWAKTFGLTWILGHGGIVINPLL